MEPHGHLAALGRQAGTLPQSCCQGSGAKSQAHRHAGWQVHLLRPALGCFQITQLPPLQAALRALWLVFIFMKEAVMKSVPLQSVCLLHMSYIGPFLSVSRSQVTQRQHPRDVYKQLLRARHCRGSWPLSPGSCPLGGEDDCVTGSWRTACRAQ